MLRNGKLTFCICNCSVPCSYHGSLPSLLFVTNADVDRLKTSEIIAEANKQTDGKYSFFNTSVVLSELMLFLLTHHQ